MRYRVPAHTLIFLALVIGAVTLLWATTDEDYEAAAGLDKALKASPATLTEDPGIEGKTIEADKAFGQKGCKAKFEFTTAKKGTYPYQAGGETIKGVYVKIKATYDKTTCEARCGEVKILQVFRDYTKDGAGGKDPVNPGSTKRQQRAGWDKPDSPSRGWQVDSGDNGPFYGPGYARGSAESGSTDTPSVERDAPGEFDGTTKRGSEFISCAVCVNAGQKSRIIACINWGYYIDASGNIQFDPKPPTASGSPAQQVKDALDRFEKISGNTSANIQF